MSVNSHPVTRSEVRKGPVQDRSRRTVEAILDSAAHFFTVVGYSATTTNHVAARAGVSIGSLYQYFPNKDALLVALEQRHLDHAEHVFGERCQEWRRTEPPIGEWASAFVAMLVSVNDSELHRILYNSAPRSATVATHAAGIVARLADETAVHLRRWGRPDDARLRAQIVIVATLATVHEIVIQRPSGRTRTRAVRRVTDMVVALLH